MTWFTHTEYVVNENYLTVSRWSQIDSRRPLLVKTTVCAVILWHTLNLFLFCFLPALSTWTHWMIELDKKCPPCCVPTPIKKKSSVSIINPEQKKRPWEKKAFTPTYFHFQMNVSLWVSAAYVCLGGCGSVWALHYVNCVCWGCLVTHMLVPVRLNGKRFFKSRKHKLILSSLVGCEG